MNSYDTLVEKYPKIFAVRPGTEIMPFPMFGFECGIGWYNIIDALCYQIQQYLEWHNRDNPNPIPQVVAEQVKEKYGTLRFYVYGGDERIDGMIRMAEAMSAVTCEQCGKPGKFRGRGWYYTACDEHTREEDLDETETNSDA